MIQQVNDDSAFVALWPRLIQATIDKKGGLDIVAEFIDAIGLNFFSYETYSVNCRDERGLVLNNLPARYCENYNANAQFEFDPMVASFRSNPLPFRIGSRAEINQLTGREAYLFHEARGFGIGEALCVPLRTSSDRCAMFGIANSDDLGVTVDPGTRIYNAVYAFAPLVDAYWCVTRRPDGANPKPIHLSDLEKKCLRWTRDGKTVWEISQIIGRSQWTVQQSLRRAMNRLDVVNKVQAVAIATHLDLI